MNICGGCGEEFTLCGGIDDDGLCETCAKIRDDENTMNTDSKIEEMKLYDKIL